MPKTKIDKRGVNSWLWSAANERSYTPAFIFSATGISKHTLGAFRDNARAPRRDQLDKLCELFKEDADAVARRYGYPERKEEAIPEETAGPACAAEKEAEAAETKAAEKKEEEKKEEKIMPAVIEEAPKEEAVEKGTAAETEKTEKKNRFCHETFGISPQKKAEFGKWFSFLLASSGFTVREYAELIGVCPQTVSNYKYGNSVPSLTSLQTICRQHDIDWKAAACFFEYADYRVPEYWFGKDYRTRTDWISIQKIVRGETGTKKAAVKKKECIMSAASSELEALRAKISSLEKENGELKAEMESSAATAADITAKLRSEIESSEARHKEETASLKARITSLQTEAAKASKNGTDPFTTELRSRVRELFPKAETVSVATDGKNIVWSVRLPGMKDATTGRLELRTEEMASSIRDNVRKAVLSRLGI